MVEKNDFEWFAERRHIDVCLVLMPYVTLTHPSIALGLLKSCLSAEGMLAEVVYANMLFACETGVGAYSIFDLCNYRRIGDWTFAGALFPDYRPNHDADLDSAARHTLSLRGIARPAEKKVKKLVKAFETMRDMAPEFIDRLARAIIEKRSPGIVGCSSVFEQHVASLALLKRIKELSPETVTLMGGANCQAGMGLLTVLEFPFVDIVFSGEAEEQFPGLCRVLMEKGTQVRAEELPDAAINHEKALLLRNKKTDDLPVSFVSSMDVVPQPDYTEYFETLARIPVRHRIQPGLLMETSRGCWWRVKRRCKFCGLNGRLRVYRVKPPERVLSEMKDLKETYGVDMIEMVDNILHMDFFNTLFPRLREMGAPYRLFYETKSNLRREQVRLMAEAGVIWIQPGIESLHDELLALMDKGTGAMINVQVLKYAAEFGLRVSWALLVAFPGENDVWHLETARWLPWIAHLQSPSGVVPIFLQRYSYYHENQEELGMKFSHLPAYRLSYPLSEDRLNDLAYYFDPEGKTISSRAKTPGIEALAKCVREWKLQEKGEIPPMLCMKDTDEGIDIYDTRLCAVDRRFRLEGIEADVYRVCEPSVRMSGIGKRIRKISGRNYPDRDIDQAAHRLIEKKILLHIHDRCLSLAVPGSVPELPEKQKFPGGNYT